MINLFKIKEKQREAAHNANGRPPMKRQTPGELRLHRDISDLNLPKTTNIIFPNGKDELMNFEVTIRPEEGYYRGGTFVFTFTVPQDYPHAPPKVKCKTKVYHPNIDLQGNVCLNILREEWNPVLNVNTLIYGLIHLFRTHQEIYANIGFSIKSTTTTSAPINQDESPNHEDPLNHDAAIVLRENPNAFEANVRRAMAGGRVGTNQFSRCI